MAWTDWIVRDEDAPGQLTARPPARHSVQMGPLPEIVFITLDPPYRIPAEADSYLFHGWAEVDDPANPELRLVLNGVELPFRTHTNLPNFEDSFPGKRALGLYGRVKFQAWAEKVAPGEIVEPVLLNVTVVSDGRRRNFEYEVTAEWLSRTFGRPLKPRRTPPEHLQIRVTGAAAGAYHAEGRKVADRIAAILEGAGRPLGSHRRILDFGCGPGRVVASMKDLHPQGRFFGCDIDEEAIAWARENLGDIADFRVNGATGPLPFADESFDFIYGISILTHLPEAMQWGVLAELRRILKPGGLFLTTKLDPFAYNLPEAVKTEAGERGFAYWGSASRTDGLPDFYRLAYHTAAYVEREWGRYFEVVHLGSQDLNYSQDAVLLRRPRHALSWLPRPVRRALHGMKTALLAGG
ncbi:MAG TPA: class I SAM-dependent methyltransferase [Phenylobacterium sp.]|nr:class I SAM-dependent methyltransferase [Phenylobacterium sp.]